MSFMLRLSAGRSLEPLAQLCGALCLEKEVWDTERDDCAAWECPGLTYPKWRPRSGQGRQPREDRWGRNESLDHAKH